MSVGAKWRCLTTLQELAERRPLSPTPAGARMLEQTVINRMLRSNDTGGVRFAFFSKALHHWWKVPSTLSDGCAPSASLWTI